MGQDGPGVCGCSTFSGVRAGAGRLAAFSKPHVVVEGYALCNDVEAESHATN